MTASRGRVFDHHVGGRTHVARRSVNRCAGVVAALGIVAWQGAPAQSPYVGFVYPAGGQRGTTVRVTIGGQYIESPKSVLASGDGVEGRVVEYNKRMNRQEVQLLREQLAELRKLPPTEQSEPSVTNLMIRLQKLIDHWTDLPQCYSIANLLVADIFIASNAPPGPRELRVLSARGLSNPMVFVVGELPEFGAPPLPTTRRAILGKEGDSLRRRRKAPAAGGDTMAMMMGGGAVGDEPSASDLDDDEMEVTLPCVINGQIAPGTIDRFCFSAKKGQKIVAAVQARDLIPYVADAVPGWFQPVIAMFDSAGQEVAYNDDFMFRPDPTLLFEVPADGLYRLVIHDAIFRGREDFVYRITLGETPFVTSVFPAGASVGTAPTIELAGWHLEAARREFPLKDPAPGLHRVAFRGRYGWMSNLRPLAVDELPDVMEQEPNSTIGQAQSLATPVIVNGRIDSPADVDIFAVEGQASARLVVETWARRLDSPLDTLVKLTDSAGALVAYNDDWEDLSSGLNTHHADSYLNVTLPSNGVYLIHLRDTQHRGGPDFVYRMRVSPPRPDFVLRAEPSRLSYCGSPTAALNVHVLRKDGFSGRIDLQLKDPPEGFTLAPAALIGTQTVVRAKIRTTRTGTNPPVRLNIVGVSTNEGQILVRPAVPAEDRMQAFFWRHLVPAKELLAVVMNPPPKPPAPAATNMPPKPAAVSPPATNAVPKTTAPPPTNVPPRSATVPVPAATNAPPKPPAASPPSPAPSAAAPAKVEAKAQAAPPAAASPPTKAPPPPPAPTHPPAPPATPASPPASTASRT